MAKIEVREGHISELKQHERNARKHTPRNIAAIEDSLQKNGFGRSLLAARDGTILAGNATDEALGNVGLEDAIFVESDGTKPIIHVRTDLDPTDKMAISLALADNRAAELAEWNTDELRKMKEEGFDFSSFWTKEEFEQHFKLSRSDGKARDDDEIRVPVETRCKPGDLWQLGRHHLLCADATDPDAISRLMLANPTNPTLLITSPPYAVGKEYDGNTREDDLNTWRQLMKDWTSIWARVVPFAAINLADLRVGPNGREVHTYGELVGDCFMAGWELVATRIWIKPPAWNMPYYAHSYRPVDDFEYIGFFGTKPYKDRLGKEVEWRYRGTWEMASVASNKDHPAKFPLELPARCLAMLSDSGDVVCDPFTGSGTTLVACHEAGRVFSGTELSPRYCDLTIGRYEALTGEEAVLIDDEN